MTYPSAPLVTAEAGGLNGATTSAIDTTGVTLIVVIVNWYAVTTAVATLTDSKGNTYTGLTQRGNASIASRIFYCLAPIVGSGHTFTVAGTSTYSSIEVQGWNGNATSSVVDTQNGTGVSTSSTQQTGSVTPSENNCLIVAGMLFASSGTVSINSGFTISDQIAYSAPANYGAAAAYLVQTTAGAVNPTWTATSADKVSSIAVFKPAGPASSLTADSGTFSLSGQDATLTKTGVPGSFTLVADQGTYTLVGSDALADYVVSAEYGVYNLTGNAAALRWSGEPVAGNGNRGRIGLRIGLGL